MSAPNFPTELHQRAAELIRDYFLSISKVDTVLLVNSCARGQAVPESDLDIAILMKPGTTPAELNNMEHAWRSFSEKQSAFLEYKKIGPYAHLHVDMIDGNYTAAKIENGEPIDFFEIEIGNEICYAAPMDHAGPFFKDLQNKWLPYYNEELQQQRLQMVRVACNYDLDHIPLFLKRELYFQAFDILCKAFQKYLQVLFIANKVYPIAYNKWIKEQIVKWLNMPDLYPMLSPIISVSNIESDEIIEKTSMLRKLTERI
jgi:predicted nucleotidyltransferase